MAKMLLLEDYRQVAEKVQEDQNSDDKAFLLAQGFEFAYKLYEHGSKINAKLLKELAELKDRKNGKAQETKDLDKFDHELDLEIDLRDDVDFEALYQQCMHFEEYKDATPALKKQAKMIMQLFDLVERLQDETEELQDVNRSLKNELEECTCDRGWW